MVIRGGLEPPTQWLKACVFGASVVDLIVTYPLFLQVFYSFQFPVLTWFLLQNSFSVLILRGRCPFLFLKHSRVFFFDDRNRGKCNYHAHKRQVFVLALLHSFINFEFAIAIL